MSARDEMLGRVRAAIGRKLGDKPAPPPEPLLRIAYRTETEKTGAFRAALEKLAGTVELAANRDEARALVEARLGGRTAIASNHSYLRACGVHGLSGVSTAADAESLRNLCAASDVGITSAYCLLAETGTLVLRAGPEEPRLISLLPPVHIAVVPAGRLLSGLDEMLSMLPRPVDSTSATVFITGPSRTGDIEQILVRGVHGPGHVHVVIVQGDN
ncbi:MAG: hypothetical protein FJW30_21855 [Acidobacteria bacterium]|nr:hypothetical protein [Acidobacteriota bacterium]